MKNHFIKKQAGSVKKTKVFETTDFLYGDHETQVSEGGEADLHKHLVGCQKNPVRNRGRRLVTSRRKGSNGRQ
ncbi:hypothetical protein Btru_073751 [Bulinus truncatus]|nr:hypothetical protein Btru_073751 [Bulinus truncatus]